MDHANNGPVAAALPLSEVAQSRVRQGCAIASAEPPTLPLGFPTTLHHPLAWTGDQFQHESDYVEQLTGSDLEEIWIDCVANVMKWGV
jgi:hypothetical protein